MHAVPPGYSLTHDTPTIADYCRLRAAAGLTPFSEAAAARGLPGTICAATIRIDHETVAMGRVIGDGGLFFQVTDIAVHPAHQGRGLGKAIVAALMHTLSARLDAPAYVSLIADGKADRLYAQYGFQPVAPRSQGMAQVLDPAPQF